MAHEPIDENSTYTSVFEFEKAMLGAYVGRWHALINDNLDLIDAAIAGKEDAIVTLPIAKGGTGTATAPSAGQLLIGKTDGSYALAALTEGANVTITEGDGTITIAASGEGGGVTDHGALTGLADDDHSQYLNTTRHDTTAQHSLGTVVPHDSLDGLTDVAITAAEQGDVLIRGASGWVNIHHGNDGDVLTSGGDGADPAWEAPTGGSAGVDTWMSAPAFTRAGDSSFTVTDNATNQGIFQKGRPLRYRTDTGAFDYAIVVNYATGTVTISGGALAAGDNDMDYGDMSRVVQLPVLIPGFWNDAADTTGLLTNDLGQELPWGQGAAHIVRVRAKTRVADSDGTADPTVNALVGGAALLDTAITLDTANWTPASTAGQVVNGTNYAIGFDELIEVTTPAKGTAGDAQDLSMQIIAVVD